MKTTTGKALPGIESPIRSTTASGSIIICEILPMADAIMRTTVHSMRSLVPSIVFLAADAAGPVGLALTGADYGAFANATALKAALLENYDLTQPPPRPIPLAYLLFILVYLLQYEAASTIQRTHDRKRALNSARRFHSTDEDHFRGTKFVHESPLGVETSKCCFRRGPAQG